MRISGLMILALFIMGISFTTVTAESKRIPRGMSGYKYKEVRDTDKTKEKDKEKKEEVKEEEKEEDKGPLKPDDVLKNMLRFENNQGILDYKVEVIEVTETGTKSSHESVQKELYFLAPSRVLTLKDGIPIYYIDEFLFEKIIRKVSVEFLKDEIVNDVDCFIIRMNPTEKAFEKNVKFYYIAKDDFRKIRIESTRYNLSKVVIFNVTDFFYRKVDGLYFMPLRSESRIYDDRDFLLQTTTATFMNWKFNIGLTGSFFDEKLKDYKLYDIVK